MRFFPFVWLFFGKFGVLVRDCAEVGDLIQSTSHPQIQPHDRIFDLSKVGEKMT